MNARPIVIFAARLSLGLIFLAHGWQKLVNNGLAATEKGFTAMGAPLPQISAPAAALVEIVGGIGLCLGLATSLWAVLLVLDMIVAYVIAHAGNGLFVADGGAELVLALGAGAALLAAFGPGPLALDRFLPRMPWSRGREVVPASAG